MKLLKLREYFNQFRRSILAYQYDYLYETNKAIIETTLKGIGDNIHAKNNQVRRISRTIAQYTCQFSSRPKASLWFFEISCALFLPAYLTLKVFSSIWRNKSKSRKFYDGVQIVFAERWKSNPEIFLIPSELRAAKIKTKIISEKWLAPSDIVLLWKLFKLSFLGKTPFPTQLVFKCAVDLAAVRGCLSNISTQYIIVYWEFSCSLSLITHALENEGVGVYNVMHGDKHFYAKHAFFESSRCYCWNSFYINIFKKGYAKSDFRVFENPAFTLNNHEKIKTNQSQPLSIGIATPHMATLGNTFTQAAAITEHFVDTINSLSKKYHITIRPHPFYKTELDSILRHLDGKTLVEQPNAKLPRKFLLGSHIVIGTISTLLIEAAKIGIQVIVIQTPAMVDIEKYHFLYTFDNVRKSSLDDLKKNIEEIEKQLQHTIDTNL